LLCAVLIYRWRERNEALDQSKAAQARRGARPRGLLWGFAEAVIAIDEHQDT
jgi:hypothetical protein